jgi:hypothetical protein
MNPNISQLAALLNRLLRETALPFLMFTTGLGSLAVQDLRAKEYPVPEFLNKPAYYNDHDTSLLQLERSPYHQIIKTKALGFGGATGGFFLDGAASPVRIVAGTNVQFIIKVTPGVDPETILELCQFTIKDGKRFIITVKATLGTGNTSVYVKIPFDVKKASEGVYVLTVSNMKPGEYFLGGSDQMFAFGVDSPPPSMKSD